MNYAPETLEGWYALHQIFRIPAAVLADTAARNGMSRALAELACPAEGGWTAAAPLIGSRADVMLIHFRPTLDAIGDAQRRLGSEPFVERSALVYSFLSVAEAGLYHLSARLAKDAEERGGAVGDDAYREALAQRTAAELAGAHVQRRLYPQPVPDMPYVCFYPMSKRREPGQNWYELSLEERSRLMTAHGMTGRRYAGRVVQVITGAIGLDAWEWGVTLFARDPLDFKKLVTDMRFDEVSARYAEFGEFFVGRLALGGEWPA
ncbi:MAG TPA: chlorite dismutase family protein [Gemmatimonadaceae bacterium]